jgi:hypothetical protein
MNIVIHIRLITILAILAMLAMLAMIVVKENMYITVDIDK